MKINTNRYLLIIILIVIFLVFYKGLQNSNIYQPNIKLDKKIPNFKTISFLSDKIIHSDEIFKSDKFYLMNIWSSWCVPCRDENQFLIDLSNEKNLEIIGLNYRDDKIKAKNFLKELGSPYKLLLSDKDGTIAIEWGAYGVPESFLIYNKKIIKKIIGPINKSLLEEIKNLIQ